MTDKLIAIRRAEYCIVNGVNLPQAIHMPRSGTPNIPFSRMETGRGSRPVDHSNNASHSITGNTQVLLSGPSLRQRVAEVKEGLVRIHPHPGQSAKGRRDRRRDGRLIRREREMGEGRDVTNVSSSLGMCRDFQ